MCDCDAYPPDFFNECVHVARKPHRCCECFETINIGEKYERATGKWDGELRTFATCIECSDIRDIVRETCECVAFYDLHDEVYQRAKHDEATVRELNWVRKRKAVAV